MQYTENITGIKINVQAVDISIDDEVKETIRKCITRLSRFYENIEWADVYLEDKKEKRDKESNRVNHKKPYSEKEVQYILNNLELHPSSIAKRLSRTTLSIRKKIANLKKGMR